MTSNFIWYELFTPDIDAAEKFYRQVIGWKSRDSGQTDKDYRIWMANEDGIGGLMAMPPETAKQGMRPTWFGYINVPDVDKAIKEITAVGGTLQWPATDIPDVGRIARVTDPHGAGFYVMTPKSDGKSTAFAAEVPGHCSWNELHTVDGKAGLRFYGEQFGWTNPENMDMGPMGTYHIFSADSKESIGGIMTKSPERKAASWIYYFCVDNISTAKARVIESGGKVHFGPEQVPSGEWVIQATDPQNAEFGLVSRKN
jgi:predicted enzyme related to lactoylglutathione lyase